MIAEISRKFDLEANKLNNYPAEEIAENCKFKDCTHNSEPHCAVRKAIKDEAISQRRFDNYSKLS